MKSEILAGFFFIVSFMIQFVSSTHWESDTQLRDLEYNGVEFVAEASHWYCPSLIRADNKTFDCNGVYYVGGYDIMVGGFNNYFQRTYYTLPTHNQVKISLTFFAMDNWDPPDRFDISIDGTVITGFQMINAGVMVPYVSPMCGNIGGDYPPFKTIFTYPHTQTTSITIQIINMLNNNAKDESIAFRDIVIDFLTVASPASSKCAISSKPLYIASDACPCSLSNQYPSPANSGTCSFCDATCRTCSGGLATNCLTCYPNTNRYYSANQCLPCYTGCRTCTGAAANQCTRCEDGYYLTNTGYCQPSCDFPLYSIGDTISPLTSKKCLTPCPSSYVLWDGTCASACATLLTATTIYDYPACTYPCLTNQYLYWNGSCLSTCPYPLTTRVQNFRNFCDFPCANSAHYLLWDASCSTNCATTLIPLVQVTEGTTEPRRYCRFQCMPNQYLYWNGSCLSTCPFPLTARITNSRLFCDFPCASTTDFLYWNGSCISGCNFPLTQKTEGTGALLRQYCGYSCGVSTNYLYWNGTCSTCLPPLKTRIDADNNFCDYPCLATQWLYWDSSCQSSCNFPLAQDIQGILSPKRFCQYYCGIDQYMYWNGSCIDRCDFPLSKRYSNSRKFCDFPCSSTTDYLYWNGSCISGCLNPLSIRTEGTPTRRFCDYPCTSSSDYLYWNKTCGSCNAPLIKRIDAKNNFCDYPCAPSEWLYWDSSCNSTCPSPALTQVAEGTPSRNYCTYQCGINQYLYWNGTCVDSCDSPLVTGTNNGRNFCYYPCQTNEFLYPNGTCASSCSPLFPPRNEDSRNYCDYPCLATQVLLYTGDCLDKCVPPYVTNVYSGNYFCDLPCLPNYYWLTDLKICNATCNTPVYFVDKKKPYLRCIPSEIILNKGNLIEAPTKPETITVLTLVRPMNYMRYLEISMPERLELLAASRGRNILATAFGLQIKSSANISFYKEKLPYVYARHNVQSSFLINYWTDLITLLIGIAAALLFYVLEKVSFSEGWETLELISKRIRVILMWNYVLMFFAWNIDDLILFVAVEYMTLTKQPEAPASTPVSFLLSLFFLSLMLGLIYLTYKIVKRRRYLLKADRYYKRSDYAKHFDTKYESCQILYRGFKDNSIFNQFFFLIYMLRIGLPMVIAVSAIKSPIFVSIFQLFINIDMLLYLFFMRPFKKLINQIQMVSYELVILMMNICVLILTTKSSTGNISADSVRLGDAIIIGNDIINILILVFLVIKIYLEAMALHKDMKRLKHISRKEKITTYLQLLALPLQQDNMGFEEMMNYYCPPPKPWFEPLIKRLWNVFTSWIASSCKSLAQDCKECLPSSSSNSASASDENGLASSKSASSKSTSKTSSSCFDCFGSKSKSSSTSSKNDKTKGGKSSSSTTNEKYYNGSLTYQGGEEGSSNRYARDEEDDHAKKNNDLSQLDGLHTYEELHKMFMRNKVVVEVDHDDTVNGRLVNQGASMMDITAGDQRGNHLDRLVNDDFNQSQSHHYNLNVKVSRNKVVPVSPHQSDMSAIGGKVMLDNTGLSLEPFLLNSQASPNDNLNAKSTTNLNVRKKRGRVHNFDLKLDSSDLQDGNQNPSSPIPDNLSPISQYIDSNQITPANNQSQISKRGHRTAADFTISHTDLSKTKSDAALMVKKDYEGYDWNKDGDQSPAFDLDDSFDKNKKKVVKRKKRINTNIKLSNLPDEAEEEDQDYLGWKPYRGGVF